MKKLLLAVFSIAATFSLYAQREVPQEPNGADLRGSKDTIQVRALQLPRQTIIIRLIVLPFFARETSG